MSKFISSIIEWIFANKECVSMTIDIIGTIATVTAVIVAIVANHKANQSIRYSLKMQEQSKNIDLFEKRMNLINDIKSSKETDPIALRILFDDTVVIAYNELQDSLGVKKGIENDMFFYEQKCRSADGEGGYVSPINDLKMMEMQLEEYNYPEDRVKEFKDFCLQHQIKCPKADTPGEFKIYNYGDLTDRLGRKNKEIKTQVNQLVVLMQEYIQRSIASIE